MDFIVVFLRDITERIHADQELAESVALFRLVTEQAPIPILLHREGRFLYINPAGVALFGASSLEDLVGRRVLDRVHPDYREMVLERIRQSQESLEIAPPLEEKLIRLDGSEIDVEVSGVPVNYLGKDAMLLFILDITSRRLAAEEKKRLETEVLHMQKLESLGRLAGGVAHDMNNVLGAIMAIGSLLTLKHKDVPGLRKDADDLMNAANRGRDLVKGLTQFARKELQEPVPLDLNALVRQEAELLKRTTLQAVDVDLDLEEPLPRVRGEANVLANALMNLCVNALDAMHGKGRLRMATRRLAPGRVELTVTDNGEGMSPEILARAMEPFFTTKPSGKGTGLGLAMVYGAVKSHGGTLDLHSRPGEGTRVSIDLPTTDDLPAVVPAPAKAETPDLDSLDVLVVDDDEMILATLPLMLTTQGHRVVTASSGAEALRRLEAGLKADLALLDMNMPGMDGMETLGRLRMLRPGLPVLVATGNAGNQDIEAILARDGRAALIQKPFTYEELRLKISTFLA
jgi:PAS domain S-box-containing protein